MYNETSILLTRIHVILRQLGAESIEPYIFYTAYAVLLAYYQPELLQNTKKFLYPKVAKHYQANCKAVEYSIHCAVQLLWNKNPSGLSAFIGLNTNKMPEPEDFIAALASNLCNLL